jgi:hypothetical protein
MDWKWNVRERSKSEMTHAYGLSSWQVGFASNRAREGYRGNRLWNEKKGGSALDGMSIDTHVELSSRTYTYNIGVQGRRRPEDLNLHYIYRVEIRENQQASEGR